MADTPQNQQAQQKKEERFSLFKPQEWPGFIWNLFWRLPGIQRFRVGIVKVGGRPHPIESELRSTWLTKNKLLFDGPLETIEKAWDSESSLLGFNDNNKEALILGNPEGIVPLYKELGAYADIERIESEKHWFQFGTGVEEEEVPFELPDEREWKGYKWETDPVRKLKEDPSQPWKRYMIKRYKLNSGVVFHEGKQEFREELYSFGYHKLRQLAPSLKDYVDKVILEDLRRTRVPVELRTKMTHVVTTFETLFQAIAKIEEQNYEKLSSLKFQVETYEKLWEKLIKEYSPERKDIIMRFPHTYIIIKTYLNEKIKNVPVKKVDYNGVEVGETIDEIKVVYFEPDKNTFKREFDDINENILRLGGGSRLRVKAEEHLREIQQLTTQINQMEINIKTIKSKAIKDIFRRRLIADLYKELYIMIRKGKKEQLRAFLSDISTKVNELADSAEEEFEDKKKELFNLVIDRLLKENNIISESKVRSIKEQLKLDESEIKDKTILRWKRITERNFEFDIKRADIKRAIDKIEKSKEAIILRRIRLIDRRKELLSLIFKKERLEHYVDHLMPRNPRFRPRPEEIGYGLDENGYPLEIDPNTGMILIDKWWNELARNEWQLKTIASKPGGVDFLKRHLGVIDDTGRGVRDVEFKDHTSGLVLPIGTAPKHEDIDIIGEPYRPIRYIEDKRFHGKIDLLDAATILFGVWDEVRDDLRDGRYHKHSKSVGDYVIEGMGNFDEELAAPYLKRGVTFGPISKGMFITRRGIIPTKSAAIKVNLRDPNVLINAKPSDFDTIPKEENAISRKFKFRIPEGVNLPTRYPRDDIIITPNGNFLIGERRSTKYNPAFDRRAETFHYMHWGKMYYYRWSGYANDWSENPFPHISTRGIALYIAFLAASDVWYYEEGEQALKGHKFDYGVRGMLKFGYNNPLSGEYALQEN